MVLWLKLWWWMGCRSFFHTLPNKKPLSSCPLASILRFNIFVLNIKNWVLFKYISLFVVRILEKQNMRFWGIWFLDWKPDILFWVDLVYRWCFVLLWPSIIMISIRISAPSYEPSWELGASVRCILFIQSHFCLRPVMFSLPQ